MSISDWLKYLRSWLILQYNQLALTKCGVYLPTSVRWCQSYSVWYRQKRDAKTSWTEEAQCRGGGGGTWQCRAGHWNYSELVMNEAGYDMECRSAWKVLFAEAEGWCEWKVDQLLPTLRRPISLDYYTIPPATQVNYVVNENFVGRNLQS